jgi:ABC-type glycerol-3-phosphate transport system substrate-binding protein
MRTRTLWTAAISAGLLVGASACGGSGSKSSSSPSAGAQELKGVTVEVAAKWTGPEQVSFQRVLSAFEKQTGAKVDYASTGENEDAYLGPRIQAHQPPDIAILPQPGLVAQYAAKGDLKPLSGDVSAVIDANYTPYWKDLGSVKGQTYGVLVKAAYKSIIWYRAKAFDDAGVAPPVDWAGFVKAAQTLSDAGSTPFELAAGSADSWTLTDWFENVYLSQAGPDMYDKLTKHQVKWTDASVTKALQTLVQIWGKPNLIAGGTAGALQQKFDGSVTDTFGKNKAAMVYGGDFAAANIGTTSAKVGTDAKVFAFPKAGATAPAVLGGDTAVAMKDSKGAMALMKYLASPEAGTVWARGGGYISPDKNVKPEAYPDALTRQLVAQMQAAGDSARYDMSDQTPAGFGGTPGQGEWEDLRSLVKNPADIKGVQARLETDAAKAYK